MLLDDEKVNWLIIITGETDLFFLATQQVCLLCSMDVLLGNCGGNFVEKHGSLRKIHCFLFKRFSSTKEKNKKKLENLAQNLN